MLNTTQVGTIMKEYLLGIPATLTTPEALAFRQQVGAEIEEMKAQGIVPEIPYDFD